MKPSQFILPAITGILGLVLGLTLAPTPRKPEGEFIATAATAFPKSSKPTDPASIQDDGKTHQRTRTRARDRVEDRKPKEPRVSVPLKTVVLTLNEKFSSNSEFNIIGATIEEALNLLGATDSEMENLGTLFKKSRAELFAAEKNLLKLGEVTDGQIRIDMSGMRGPAEDIIGRTKDGIRSILPADMAEALIAGIHWDKYYPTDEKLFVRLELTRKRTGKLMAWEYLPSYGSGTYVSDEFTDDGTPVPAERIFPDRWKPLLKGVTILPKDDADQ